MPVLLHEVLQLLNPRPGDTALDCTAGLGGHAAAIAERLGPTGTLVLCDLDPANLAAARSRVESLPSPPRVVALHTSYSEAPRRLAELGLVADVVLADLGFASNQLEDPARGLSFSHDGPLDMRLDPTSPITAAELVNSLSERELTEIIREFGEERYAAKIAEKLVRERKAQPIQTTARLADIARQVVGPKSGSATIDPATRTFQALRIAVNDELGRLGSLLDSIARAATFRAATGTPGSTPRQGAQTWLAAGARVGIIAFHSLEDRPVKQAIAALVQRGLAVALTKKPITAGDEEMRSNPRARSAKLRALRLAGPGAILHSD